MLYTRRVAATIAVAFAFGLALAGSASAYGPAGQHEAATGNGSWGLGQSVTANLNAGIAKVNIDITADDEVPWT